jgi:hypothetical protein
MHHAVADEFLRREDPRRMASAQACGADLSTIPRDP